LDLARVIGMHIEIRGVLPPASMGSDFDVLALGPNHPTASLLDKIDLPLKALLLAPVLICNAETFFTSISTAFNEVGCVCMGARVHSRAIYSNIHAMPYVCVPVFDDT
jgi:hypothetical protein